MKWLIFFLTLWSIPAWAETATLTEGQVLRGRFVQERYLQGFAKPVQSTGRFVLAPGQGLIWMAEQPFSVTTVVTPKGLVQNVNGNEVTRLPTSRLPFLARLYAMMSGALAGDWSALDQDFAVGRVASGLGFVVTLTPKRADDPTAQAIGSIVLHITRVVDEVDIIKPSGDHDHLRFSDQQISNGPLGADESTRLEAANR